MVKGFEQLMLAQPDRKKFVETTRLDLWTAGWPVGVERSRPRATLGVMALYCHLCAVRRQRIYRPPANPLASAYQLKKYLKHSVLDPTFAVQSIFTSASMQTYETYIVEAITAGAVEEDAKGRWNLIVPAGKQVGVRYEHGRPVVPEDAIKAVLSAEDGRVHAFSIESRPFLGVPCVDCGRVAII